MVFDSKKYKLAKLIGQEDADEKAWIETDNRHRQYTGYDFDGIVYRNAKDQSPATAEEIAEAKIDGISPRCNKMIFVDPEGVYCPCGFSF